MLRIELPVNSDNCIETVSKREYDLYMRRYLEKESQDLKEKIELLYQFLTSVEFRKLRGESEKYIMQGKRVKFIVYPENGEAKYEMKVES